MIAISDRAQHHFHRMLEREKLPDLGLRLAVEHPGTPRAACQLTFCLPAESLPDDVVETFAGFALYIAQSAVPWLHKAEIDWQDTATGGELTIKAPGLKGKAPAADAPLAERVRWVLEQEINPRIAAHGGRVVLEAITAENAAVLRFGGGCHGCRQVDVTLKFGVEKTLREKIPDLAAVIDATDHAQGENPYYR